MTHPLSKIAMMDSSEESLRLTQLLEQARHHKMTPKEQYEQKVSWLMGMSGKLADPMPSRVQIVNALAEMGVYDPDVLARPICENCGCRVPDGCGGLFEKDGRSCLRVRLRNGDDIGGKA